MSKHKLSVILPNYNKPADRFTSYGTESYSILEQIEICGKQGIAKGVETLMLDGPTFLNDQNSKEVKAALNHHGLTLCSLIPYTFGGEFIKGSLGSSDSQIRRKAIDLIKQTIDLAAKMDCLYVGQWPGQDGWDFHFEADYQEMYDNWVTGMQELADYNPDIKLGLEPKPFEPRAYSFIDTTPKTLLLINDIGRKNVGICLDIGHSMYGHENLAEMTVLAGERLFHLHMNDNHNDADWDMPFGSVHFLGLVEFFYWLIRTGFDGWHSVDIFPYRTDPRESVLESLRWMDAIYGFVEKAGQNNLDTLIQKNDGLAGMRFFRELVFGK